MRAQLVPVEGGAPIEISKDLTVFGRKDECDVRLDHKSVSKMHCVIVKTDGLLLLRDLGSTNGTRVNGQRVRRAALLPNDRLTIAGFNFRILFGGVHPPVSPEEHTQQINSRDLSEHMQKAEPGGGMGESSLELPGLPVQPNNLPDVYPEENSPAR